MSLSDADDSHVEATAVGADSDASRPKRLQLVVGVGEDVTAHALPADGLVTLGRALDVTIRVDEPSVSRLHAQLHMGAQIRLEDLASANGTRLGGTRLRPRDPLIVGLGQVIELGSTWMMLVPLAAAGSANGKALGRIKPEALASRVRAAERGESREETPPSLVVHDDRMRELHELVDRVAKSDMSVMLLGETGVGKEVFARRIHELSPRAGKPFVGLNCAAISDTMLESELFGHERGAYTGALQSKPGLLETAQGGTVLLDEIGEVPWLTQVKLLRVLEERHVLRLGSTKPRPIDVRIVSATNRDLAAAVEERTFRRDLFFRLNGVLIVIPPLRERVAEIVPLARAFVAQAANKMGLGEPPSMSAETAERLRRYRWPGNVRELKNVMERAVLMSGGGPISVDHLPRDTYIGPMPTALTQTAVTEPRRIPPEMGERSTQRQPSLGEAGEREGDDRARITAALEQCAGNQTRAAALLGISRRTLVSRLSEYNLPRPRKRDAV